MKHQGSRRRLGRNHPWFRRSTRPLTSSEPASDRGFTIIELIVAVSVFSIVAGGIAAMAGSGLNLSRNNRERSIAANLASADQDAAVSLDFTDLVAEVGTPTVTQPVVGNTSYTLTRDVGWEAREGETNICGYTAGDATTTWVLRVTSTVSWPNRPAPMSPGSATTIVSPPVGYTQDSSQGTAPVTVSDPSQNPPAPVDQVPVLVNGTLAGYTNEQGCMFLLLDTGSYTVSLGLANYVDREGNSSPSESFSIRAGGNMPKTFDYAPVASLTVTPSAPSDASMPTGIPLRLWYQFFPAPGTKTIVTGFPATIGSLFPATYDLWTGDCEDADPASSYWPPGDRSSATAPGSGTVAMGGVAVTASSGGSPVVGATVVASHNPRFGTCPTGSTSKSGITLGTTDSAGQLTSALPFGHWRVSVGAGSAIAVEVSPTGSGLVSVVVT